MAVKFSQFDGTITPVKTSETQFIVGFEGTTNAKWTMKALADEIGGGGDNIYTADGSLSAARTVNMDGNNLTFSSASGFPQINSTKFILYPNGNSNAANADIFTLSGRINFNYLGHQGQGLFWNSYNTSITGYGFSFYGGGAFTHNSGYSVIGPSFGPTSGAALTARLGIIGKGNTNATYGLRVQNVDGIDTFSVDDTGLVSVTGDTANSRLGLRFIPSKSAGGSGQFCKIQDTNGNDWIQKYQGAVSSNRSNILFVGKANGYASENNIVINGPGNVGAPSDNQTNIGDSSLWVWQGGNIYGQYITGKTQDSTSTALLVRNWNGNTGTPSFDTYFQLRNDKRLIYNDGNEAAGKVLTCDANGVATWATASGGDNIYTADGDILAARTINDRAGGFTGTAGSNALKMNVRNSGALMVAGYQNNGDPGTTNNCVRWGPGTTAGGMDVRGNLALSGGGGAINLTGSSGQFFTVTQTGTTINTTGNQEYIAPAIGFGTSASTNYRVRIKGATSTSSGYSLQVQNSSNDEMLSIRDDGQITIGSGATIQSTSNPQYSVVMGYGAKDRATAGNAVESVAIGRLAAGNGSSVAIGGQAKCLGVSAVAIGAQAQAAATGTSIGLQAGGASAGSSAVSIGKFAQAKASGSIAIGTNTGLTGANSIVLNATTGVTSSTTTDTFDVYMSDVATPDFKIAHDGNSYITGTGNFGFGVANTSPTATVDIDGTFRLRSASSVSGKVLTADANGNGTWQTASSGGGYSPTISVENTNGGDVDLYDDNIVRLWLDDSSGDDIELEITNYASSTSSTYHVNYTNYEGGASSARTTTVDLNQSGATSTSTLDFNFTDDECMKLRIWSPRLGLGVGGEGEGFPFYEITIVKSGTLYTGSPVITSVLKSTS